ncbi:hypothetical protein J4447_02490 [Candidatus Pacearchaeota archaeon]|nr:hypothetical protein [Candidatus Pacearchaeota archaeon]
MSSEERTESEVSESVFETKENPRHAYLFVPQSNKGLSVKHDLVIWLGRIYNDRREHLDAIYLSLRTQTPGSFERAKRSLDTAMEFCLQNDIRPLESYNHAFLLGDLAGSRGEDFTSIAYVARYREADIDKLAENLKKMIFDVERIDIG